jgi:hypothetical protein
MQFLQEFSIEQGVIFIQTDLILGFVWEFCRNGGRLSARLERLSSLKKGGLGEGFFVLKGSYDFF